LAIAANALEADVHDLEAAAGKVWVRGTPSASITIADVARMAYVDPVASHPNIEPGLEAVFRFRPTRWPTWSNGAHACIVEIDPATCIPRIVRYVVVEDCGPMINPTVVEGQIRGAVIQGVGGVLYEHFVYDEAGNPLTSTFVDYLLPTAAESPDVELTFLPSPSTTNPGGFKGVAENGTLSAPAAVANAIGDALAPLGVTVTSTNLGPNEIFTLLKAAGAL
jgi:carbon-monoxide dehydrogenase large subunit